MVDLRAPGGTAVKLDKADALAITLLILAVAWIWFVAQFVF